MPRPDSTRRLLRLATLALFPLTVCASPSAQIEKLLETPATAFDVYLHRLYVEGNGQTFLGGPNMQELLRMSFIRYDIESNTISMTFQIRSAHKSLAGFAGRDLDGKKSLLLSAAREVSESVGVEYRDSEKTLRLGIIQATPIRNGWATKDLDEQAAKEEIANRTEVVLIFAEDPRLVYRVRRTTQGRYEFAVDTKQTR